MALDHESPEVATQLSLDFGEAARREALDNGTGFSPHTIDTMQTGIDADANVGYHGLAQRVRAAAKSMPNRRGGRSYNEGSDSDLDPYWSMTDPAHVSEEERVAGHRAYLAAKAEIARRTAVSEHDKLVQTAKEHGVSVMALLRARDDIAARNKSA